MSTHATRTDAIRKTIAVDREVEDAFRLFTEGMGSWWPVKDFSAGGEAGERVVFEARPGGRIYEVQQGGKEVEWGTVLQWDAPERVVFSWGLNGSEIEVTFAPAGNGTRVELEHRGWDKLEDKQERESYDAGWDVILARYAEAAA